MPYVTREQLNRAKKVDLLTYLQHYEPDELVRIGPNSYTTRTHDSLKISNGMWIQWSTDIGGRSALDYLIKIRGMSLPDAVMLINSEPVRRPKFTESKQKFADSKLILPERSESCTAIIRYLTGRGIDRDIVLSLIRQGRIYEEKNYHNVVFTGIDSEGNIRHAAIRATDGSRFMLDAQGSDKRYSFSLIPEEKGTLHVFESVIDALSFLTLEKRNGRDWRDINVLSLSGISKNGGLPAALRQTLANFPEIRRIELHLDNDQPGREAAKGIMSAIPEEIECADRPPPSGKDYNDHLISTIKSKIRKDLIV